MKKDKSPVFKIKFSKEKIIRNKKINLYTNPINLEFYKFREAKS